MIENKKSQARLIMLVIAVFLAMAIFMFSINTRAEHSENNKEEKFKYY